jgi:aminoglycoside phosphotransferase (APT) family kinase protein
MSRLDVERLTGFFGERLRADEVRLDGLRALSGGAIQENWAVDVVWHALGRTHVTPVVVRSSAQGAIAESSSRAREFELLQAVYDAGVTVPEPLWYGEPSWLGREFFVMRRVRGVASAHRIVRDMSLAPDRNLLTERLGEEIAKIQSVGARRLGALERPSRHPALAFVDSARGWLDAHAAALPAIEWGLRWIERNVPDRRTWHAKHLVLAHRDLRTGNYMIDANGLTAILDWEFAGWSHPLEDLGWFCAPCWRFGRAAAAGGIGSRDDLLRGYNRVSGGRVAPADIAFWETVAQVRWAVIALQQGERSRSGQQPSLELALTSHLVPQLELDLLRATGIDFEVSHGRAP